MVTDLDALRRAEEEVRHDFPCAHVTEERAHECEAPYKLHPWHEHLWVEPEEVTSLVAAVERRVGVERYEGMEDAFMIEGVVAPEDGTPLTTEQVDEFTDAFLTWLEQRGLGFGGALGIIHEPRT